MVSEFYLFYTIFFKDSFGTFSLQTLCFNIKYVFHLNSLFTFIYFVKLYVAKMLRLFKLYNSVTSYVLALAVNAIVLVLQRTYFYFICKNKQKYREKLFRHNECFKNIFHQTLLINKSYFFLFVCFAS